MPLTTGTGDPAVRPDGRATRWDSHRASRRADLVHAARRAVHHHGPDLSMDDLAAEIGTSKSILYRYFADKTGLQTAVGQAVLEGLREALEDAGRSVPDPRERLAAMVSVYLEMVEASSNVYTFVTRPEAEAAAGALRGFVAEIEDMVGELLLPVLREGVPGPDGAADPHSRALAQLWGSGLVGLVRAVGERWFGHRNGTDATDPTDAAIARMDRRQLTEQITDWLWDGAAGVTHHHDHTATTRPERR